MSFSKFAFLLVLVCSIPVLYAYGQLDDKPAQGILAIRYSWSKIA